MTAGAGHRWSAWAKRLHEQDLGRAATATAGCLARYANRQGLCWPSRRTIAREIRYSERQTIRAIQELELRGLIQVDRGGGDPRVPSLYQLLPVTGDKTSPATGDKKTPPTGDIAAHGTGELVSPRTTTKATTRTPTPPQPPRGGRHRDRERYENNLTAWVATNLPELRSQSEAHRAVDQALRSGTCRNADEIRTFIAKWWPHLNGQEARAA